MERAIPLSICITASTHHPLMKPGYFENFQIQAIVYAKGKKYELQKKKYVKHYRNVKAYN